MENRIRNSSESIKDEEHPGLGIYQTNLINTSLIKNINNINNLKNTKNETKIDLTNEANNNLTQRKKSTNFELKSNKKTV